MESNTEKPDVESTYDILLAELILGVLGNSKVSFYTNNRLVGWVAPQAEGSNGVKKTNSGESDGSPNVSTYFPKV